MKASVLALAIFGLLVSGVPELRAQVFGPSYAPSYWDVHYQQYLQWQQYLEYLRQTDPYYDLHTLHYQLYLRPYQAYLAYPPYLPCCYAVGIPVLSGHFRRAPHGAKGRVFKPVRRR
ncbi:MAG TPA: hypothetical protein VE131_05260 [Terriglobales bacterium]|nr:hypothetical protein [Terriglobales bacterium]